MGLILFYLNRYLPFLDQSILLYSEWYQFQQKFLWSEFSQILGAVSSGLCPSSFEKFQV